MRENTSENVQAQMRKGTLEFATLLSIGRGEAYASGILEELKAADLLVVEGTLYPLLSRLRQDELLTYRWEESKTGPPRKYYQLTDKGKETLGKLTGAWREVEKSINSLIKKYEKSN
jgi:PadR family transcriptional regulator PadR